MSYRDLHFYWKILSSLQNGWGKNKLRTTTEAKYTHMIPSWSIAKDISFERSH